MSKIEQTLRISTYQLIDELPKEELISRGHTCTMCSGEGYRFDYSSPFDSERVECPVCRGRGQLMARITIEWSPMDTPSKEEWRRQYRLLK